MRKQKNSYKTGKQKMDKPEEEKLTVVGMPVKKARPKKEKHKRTKKIVTDTSDSSKGVNIVEHSKVSDTEFVDTTKSFAEQVKEAKGKILKSTHTSGFSSAKLKSPWHKTHDLIWSDRSNVQSDIRIG